MSEQTVSSGIGFGCALAIAVSYGTNHHMGWAILHGLLSWIYVAYRALGFGE